jgi:hypothetical protein
VFVGEETPQLQIGTFIDDALMELNPIGSNCVTDDGDPDRQMVLRSYECPADDCPDDAAASAKTDFIRIAL